MAGHREGDYTLLDVRQPGIRRFAFSRAKLMPLPELSDTYKELDPEKPLSCTARGRASRWHGPDALRLGVQGGLQPGGRDQAYEGHKATGQWSSTWTCQRGRVPRRSYSGLRMEKALQLFTNPEAAIPDQIAGAVWKLAQVEVRHEQRLFEVYGGWSPAARTWQTLNRPSCRTPWKALLAPKHFLETNKSHLQPPLRCSIWP